MDVRIPFFILSGKWQ